MKFDCRPLRSAYLGRIESFSTFTMMVPIPDGISVMVEYTNFCVAVFSASSRTVHVLAVAYK